jgi:hypothetical protein
MLTPPLQLGLTVTASLCITEANCHQSTNFANGPPTCEDNIKMDLKEVGCKGMDCIHLDHQKAHRQILVNTEIKLRFPLQTGNFLTI